MMINDELKERLRVLAGRYETACFSDGDPSCILKRYDSREDTECAAFTAAMLSFGQRNQFLKKIQYILDLADSAGGPAEWITSGRYIADFKPPQCGSPDSYKAKFYRFYSYQDMIDLFNALRRILVQSGTLGSYFEVTHARSCAAGTQCPPHLSQTIGEAFAGCAVVPKGRNSANKRLHMFLRWMVRRGSPVDLGLWSWYDPAALIIPLDTHVIRQSVQLGLLPPECPGTAKTAALLTERLKQIWPDDPCRGDFALFGLGTDTDGRFFD